MEKTFIFNKKYFAATLLLLLVEVCIALFIKDRFIRPYVGDYLVVILMYCFIKTFFNASPVLVGSGVLLFAIAVEIGQYFDLVELLHLSHSELARTIVGTGFDWGDLLAYLLGILTVMIFEKTIQISSI